MLDLVYIAHFDFLLWAHIADERALPRARLSCAPDEAAALMDTKHRKRLTIEAAGASKQTKA